MPQHITYHPGTTSDGRFQVFGSFTTDGGSGCLFSPVFDTESERDEWLRKSVALRPPEEVTVICP